MSRSKLPELLRAFKADRGAGHTHTRIPNPTSGKPGGIFRIDSDQEQAFHTAYVNQVFDKRTPEHLTEKQHLDWGPLLIDVDLRFAPGTASRQHTDDHVTDLVVLYLDKIRELTDIEDGSTFDAYVMQKTKPNVLADKTKDGIHIIIAASLERGTQLAARAAVLDALPEVWDGLPITNTWEDVLDEGVAKGSVNWQMYGSRKPGHEAYMLHRIISLTLDGEEWSLSSKPVSKFDLKKNFGKLSARCLSHPRLQVRPEKIAEVKKFKARPRPTQGRPAPPPEALGPGGFGSISNMEMLDAVIEQRMTSLEERLYVQKETHDYTLALPNSYYGPGSYNRWLRVGWALCNTDRAMFPTWLKFSAQENCRNSLRGSDGKFDWDLVPELYEKWQGFASNKSAGLSHRSIMYWCKVHAPEKYAAIRKETVGYFVDQTLRQTGPGDQKPTQAEFDLASVLHSMFADKYVCASIKNNIWYEYEGNRWHEVDSGSPLRMKISQDMHELYVNRVVENMGRLEHLEQTNELYEKTRKETSALAETAGLLRKTQWKNNIMKECKFLFYDRHFLNKLDQDPYLLCFNNTVVDFRNGTHRNGQPDDYISKCTGIDYIPYEHVEGTSAEAEVMEFMEQLFPDSERREYMWQHLASVLIGTNENQTFNLYTGVGSNGKSKLVELMGKALGEYKGTVPITLVTQKRNCIGSTSSEIVQLMGTRYAVMQEPSKGDRINEGIMKEITGGDPIQGRALFKDTVTFIPQFKLVVCTNELLDVKSNDDGTWRRIRVCEFESKFLDKPYSDEDRHPRSCFPHQFMKDKSLDKKFETWAPVLMSLLVARAHIHKGRVEDCQAVLASSDKYRENQDYLVQFVKDRVHTSHDEGVIVPMKTITMAFRTWYENEYQVKKAPPPKEIKEYMAQRFSGRVIRNRSTGAVKAFRGLRVGDDEEDDDAAAFNNPQLYSHDNA